MRKRDVVHSMEPSPFTDSFTNASPMGGIVEGLDAAAQPLSPRSKPTTSSLPEFVPDEILVQFRPSIGVSARREARALLAGTRQEAIQTPVMQRAGMGVLERIALPQGGGANLWAAIAAISRNPNVVFAEPNYLYRPAVISNDPLYTNGSLWGMYGSDSPAVGPSGTTNPFGSQAERAWNDNITGSSNVVVGIIDEGIQVNHPDLVNNIWVNPYDPVDGVDNDGNGYVDDVNGWDFVSNDNSVYDAGQDAHGTHVAGTIGGDGGNGIGVAGVNWDVKMIAAKFLGPTGGTTADAVEAVDYLTGLKARHGINLVASNNSWGGGGYSRALHDAIIRGAKRDILFIAAAGNSTSDNDSVESYPSNYNTTVGTSSETAASYDAVIAVASITNTGAISDFSSFGAATVDLGAPGSGINSTIPSNSYASYSGTSMATPHVTGAAALLASASPAGVSAATLRSLLLNSTTPTASLAGKTVTGGRLDVYAALSQANFLSLDRDRYTLPATVAITVNHRAANLSSTGIDTISLSISSTSESTPEIVVLSETESNSGSFTGSIPLAPGQSQAADGQLQAADGDQISAFYAPLNQTVTARVDVQPPLISNVSAAPKVASSTILWSTNEAASSEVLFGTSADALTSTVTAAALVTAHAAVLSGLLPRTTYYYQVRSRDSAGNVFTDPTIRSFETAAPAPILFVDDDQGASYERFYTAALQANGYSYDSWNVSTLAATPTAQDLAPYGVVIWNTGYDFSSAGAGLAVNEQNAIASYLDGGGRIYISGQDILYNGVSSAFLTNYLKLSGFSNDVLSNSHTEAGISGHPISNGQNLSIAVLSDFPSLYVDAITPVSGAQATFRHDLTTTSSPHSAVNFRGDYAAGGFGMVFTTFPFEAVSTSAADPNNQKVLLKRILDYLGLPSASINVGTVSATATTEAGGSVSVSLSLGKAPSHDVVIPLSSSDASEATVSPASLTFTPTNWATAQTIMVTGVDDAVDDGDVTYAVVLGSVSSGDAAYNGQNPSDISFSNTDNDTAGITVSTPSGSSTSEAGGTVTFSLVLNSEPTAAVTIPLSSSSPAEGAVSATSLSFNATNWSTPQTVTVTGVDDSVYDGTRNYNVVIGAASSSDALYNGRNPADLTLTNLDNEPAPQTKFFVVNDGSPDRTFEYAADGLSIENYTIAAGNTAPRGIASIDGSITWVVDANRRVYVYNGSGQLLGEWLAGTMSSNATVEGIATDGTNIWIVDARSDRVFYYAGGASLRSSSAPVLATGNFALNSGNTAPKDLVFGRDASNAGYLWVVNDASSDRTFRYSVAADGGITLLNSWTLNSNNKAPTGITLDPGASSGDLWIVNNGSPRQIFRYQDGRTLTAPTGSVAFVLNSANGNPQGLADPPSSVIPNLPGIPTLPSIPELPQRGEAADLIRDAIRRGMREVIRTVGPLTRNSPRRVEAWLEELDTAVRRSYPTAPAAIVRSVLQEALAVQKRLLRKASRR